MTMMVPTVESAPMVVLGTIKVERRFAPPSISPSLIAGPSPRISGGVPARIRGVVRGYLYARSFSLPQRWFQSPVEPLHRAAFTATWMGSIAAVLVVPSVGPLRVMLERMIPAPPALTM